MKTNKLLKVISSLTLVSIICYTLPVMAYTKEETVYSKLDSEGNSYKTIVSNHIKNINAQQTIKDISDLLNIENTNGYETFERYGNTVVWNANGNDIYYQGESEKQLPISCHISYELDRKEISKEEILGKSGNVKITLEYTNNEKHIVNINGRNEIMYTPFLVVTGTVINNETNKNIKISNGKIMDDGTKTVVVGMAFPGMQESLGLKEKDFELPSKIEIEMDTTDFELDTIASFVTPKIIESKEDLKKLDKIDEVYQKISTLQSASDEILKGAQTLKQGTEEYSDKKQEFNTAMKQVAEGMSNANQSYNEINTGITTLNKSSKELGNGAKKVSEGTEQVSQNLNLIADKLSEAEEGSKKLETGEQQLVQGLDKITTSLNTKNTTETAKNLQTLIKQNDDTIKLLTKTNETLKAQITETNSAQLTAQIEANKNIITLLTANKKSQEETLNTLQASSQLQEGINSLKNGITALQEGNKELTKGITSLKNGANTLASKTKELNTGANSLYKGSTQLSNGTQKIEQGSNKMKEGLNTLDISTTKLSTADDALTEGSKTIEDGANSLYEGIFKFNKEGINPICDAINNNLSNVTKRVKKLGELSLEYNNYTLLENGEDGSVQFVMLVDGLKKESKQKQDGEEIILKDDNRDYSE